MNVEERLEQFSLYLPKFLSAEDVRGLYDEFDQFPDNLDARMYSSALHGSSEPFQGDGIRDLLVLQLPSPDIRSAPSIIVSNSCDISFENDRKIPIRLSYAPIIRLERFEKTLLQSDVMRREDLENYILDVRRQRVTNVFYLPKGSALDYEGMAMLDRMNNCPAAKLKEGSLQSRRIFSLSHYGFYLFVLKISIHFTRIRADISR